MQTSEIAPVLASLCSELANGAPAHSAFVLNGGDIGMLASLDRLSAEDASQAAHGGATIAAHVRHVIFGLSLMNQWARDGGNPFASADWGEAWNTTSVDEGTWRRLRGELRSELEQWLPVLQTPRDVEPIEISGMVASVVHLAYHLGAIRQIAKGARGPKHSDVSQA